MQATSIVNERMNTNKTQTPPTDSKKGQVNNNKDLEVDRKEEPSFFGSFFSSKNPTKKKGLTMDAPPPIIRPQSSSLSERETMETEVISMYNLFYIFLLITYSA